MTGLRTAGPVAVVEELLAGLSTGDVDAALASAAEDLVMSIPFQPEGMVRRLEGREAVRAFLARVVGLFEPFVLTLTEADVLEGGDGVVARYEGRATVVRTGRPYDNSYISVFRFRAGRLTEWTEFANPLVVAAALRPGGPGE